jgi:hypothetical protein
VESDREDGAITQAEDGRRRWSVEASTCVALRERRCCAGLAVDARPPDLPAGVVGDELAVEQVREERRQGGELAAHVPGFGAPLFEMAFPCEDRHAVDLAQVLGAGDAVEGDEGKDVVTVGAPRLVWADSPR